MITDQLVPCWYVLHTKSRFENVVNDSLNKKKVEVFLPKIQVKSKRRDRRVMIRVPLFPGYIFVKTTLEPNEHIEILKTVGAVRLIGNRDRPVDVPEDTITSLKIMVASGDEIDTGTQLRRGDRVLVVRGPFTGITGIFVRYSGNDRIVVHIEALGQFAAVNVNEEDVEILPEILG